MHENYVYFFYKDQGSMILEVDFEERTSGNTQMLPSYRAKFKGYEGEIYNFYDGKFIYNSKRNKFVPYEA